jgi:hypothetical protein
LRVSQVGASAAISTGDRRGASRAKDLKPRRRELLRAESRPRAALPLKEYRRDLVDPRKPQGDYVIVERGTSLPEVLVGERAYHHHEHGRYVEEFYHDPAQRPPPTAHHSKEPDPKQGVPQIEEYIRAHEIKKIKRCINSEVAVSGNHADGF